MEGGKSGKGTNNKKSFYLQSSRTVPAVSKLFESIQQLVQEKNNAKFTFLQQHCKQIVEEVKKCGYNAEFFRVKMQSFINVYLDLVESNRTRQVSLIQLLNKIDQENIEKSIFTQEYPFISQVYLQVHNLFHKYKRQSLQNRKFIDFLLEENKKNQNQKTNFFSAIFASKSDKNLPKNVKISKSFGENYEHNKKYLNIIEDLKRDLLYITQKNEVLQQNIEKYKEILSQNQFKKKFELNSLQEAMDQVQNQMQKKIDEVKRNNFQLTKQKEYIEANAAKMKIKYQRQAQKLQRQIDQLRKNIEQLQSKLQQTKRQILRKQAIEKPKVISKQLQKQKMNTSGKITMTSSKNIIKQQPKKSMVQSNYRIKIQAPYEKVFQGQILRNDLEKKTKLIEIIQLHTKKQILDTNLLYTLDLKNPTNIHEYIDGYQHLLVLIKMENGHVLGAFSQDRLQQTKEYSQSSGFLFSLTKKKVFAINRENKESKVLTYEQNWVIFGNSELRIQSNSDVIFSNLGIANRFMGKKGDSYRQLLGTNAGQKQAVAKSYEFYRISFVH